MGFPFRKAATKNPFGLWTGVGIRKRVFLLLVVVFIPLLLLQGFTFRRWYLDSKKAEIQANLELARTVSKTFEAFINDVLHTQLTIALAATANPPPSKDSLRGILQAAEAINPMLRSFAWISPEGVYLVTTNPEIENQKVRTQTLFSRIVSGEEYGVGDVHNSPFTGEKVFAIGRGIRDAEGNLLGFISCVCLADKLDHLLAVQRSKNASIGLIDSKGIRVYRYPTRKSAHEQMNWLSLYPAIQDALKGKEVAGEAFGSEGEKRLGAFAPVSSIGWAASSSRAEHEVIENITRALLPHVAFIMLVTLAAFLAAVFLSRPISTSMRRLLDQAVALGTGDVERLEVVHGPCEIKNLSKGFIAMAEKVQSREQALQRSEQKFRSLFENSPDGVFLTGLNFSPVAANKAACAMVGYSEEEICNLCLDGIIGRSDLKLSALFQERQRTGRILAREFTAIRKSGETFPVEVDSVILPTDDLCSFVIMRDITERKKGEEALRESEEKFRSLVETTSDRIWETDAHGVYTFVNSRIHDLLGYEPEEVLGRTPFAFMPLEESARMKARFSTFARERKAFVGIENINIGKDGRRVVLETSGVPRLDGRGNLLGYRGVDRDITDRKRAEDALQKSHDQLELRVRERTAELEQRNQELQNFTFAAAHDLQEPLRKIQTFSDLLVIKCAGLITAEGREYITRMRETACRMREVLNSLMKYSRLSTKAAPFALVDLNDVARDVVSDFEFQIRDTGAVVEIEKLPEMEADAGQMRQLFQNLIGNALKYRREGIQPIVRIYISGNPQNSECDICFHDNGLGFMEKYLDRIFKPFQRLHNKDEYGGIGMGLTICSKVVEHHRGKITARSTPGKGSTFIVTLPLDRRVRGSDR